MLLIDITTLSSESGERLLARKYDTDSNQRVPIETVQFQRACSVLRAKNAEEIKITSIVETYDTEGIEKP